MTATAIKQHLNIFTKPNNFAQSVPSFQNELLEEIYGVGTGRDS